LAALAERLADMAATPLVSHEDHTPGQGQYAERAYYERYMMGSRGMTAEEAVRHVDNLIAERSGRLGIREEAMDWLAGQARAGRIRLIGHDLTSQAEVDELVARGGAVAEFPTTLAAAQAARDHGLPVVMGAPNVLRGNSHNGNASGRERIDRGRVTPIAWNSLPSSLLAAAFAVADGTRIGLPAAIGLVTSGPADAAGLA